MKTRIAAHDMIVLTPEGDAESALMMLWSRMDLRKAGHVYRFGPHDGDGRVTSLSISFHEKKQVDCKAGLPDNSPEDLEAGSGCRHPVVMFQPESSYVICPDCGITMGKAE